MNNLTYQNAPFTAQIPSDTFEMVTGAVALDAPFGQTVMGLATQLGLANSGLDATLVSGDYTSAHTCGWTEFDVDPATKELRVVTYGIAPYTAADWRTTRGGVAARQPQVVQEFRVTTVLSAVLANRAGGSTHLE